jgi:hypothetical protein
MGKLKECFKKLQVIDVIGKAPQLNLNGTLTRKTPIGGLLTLALIGILIAYLIRVFTLVFSVQNPIVSIVTEFTGLFKQMSIVNNNLLPILGLYQISKPQADGRIIFGDKLKEYVHFRVLWKSYVSETSDGDQTITIKEFEVKPCKDLQNKAPYKLAYGDKFVKDSLDKVFNCIEVPENDGVFIQGTLTSLNTTSMTIYAYPAPRDVSIPQDPPITELGILTYGAHNFVKLSDYHDPIKSNLTNSHAFFLSHQSQTVMRLKMKATNLKDITPYDLVKKTPIQTFWNAEVESHTKSSTPDYYQKCTLNTFNTNKNEYYTECPYYGSIDYTPHGQEVYMTRKYPDLIEGISQVGGMKEILLIAFGIIYSYYNFSKVKADLNEGVISKPHKQILSEIIEENSGRINSMGAELEKETKVKHARIIKEVQGLSQEMVMRNTNVATIVQDLGILLHIKNLIFDPVQLALLPLVSIQSLKDTISQGDREEQERKLLAKSLVASILKPDDANAAQNELNPRNPQTSTIKYKDEDEEDDEEKISEEGIPSKRTPGMLNDDRPILPSEVEINSEEIKGKSNLTAVEPNSTAPRKKTELRSLSEIRHTSLSTKENKKIDLIKDSITAMKRRHKLKGEGQDRASEKAALLSRDRIDQYILSKLEHFEQLVKNETSLLKKDSFPNGLSAKQELGAVEKNSVSIQLPQNTVDKQPVNIKSN